MRVIIGGSRSISDSAALYEAIAESGFAITKVYTGNSRGVDALAAAWAAKHNIPVVIMPIEWSLYGGRAEQIRNEQIAAKAEACILVWDGFSHGTRHLRAIVEKRGIRCCVYQCNPQQATDRQTTNVFRTGT